MDTSFDDRLSPLLDATAETADVPSSKALRRRARKEAKHRKVHQRHAAGPLEPRNETQAILLECLRESNQIFAIGAAGTGKTYLSTRHGVKRLMQGEVERLYIARPTVSKPKHRQGFLPGNLNEKLGPWLIPIMDAVHEEVGKARAMALRNEGKIEIISFEHLRGRTFANSVVILDEAQNCDFSDLRTFLTRIGENTQLIVSGDLDQIDIPDSGLRTIVDMIEECDLSADIVEFGSDDVVRSAIAKEWVKAFETMPLSYP